MRLKILTGHLGLSFKTDNYNGGTEIINKDTMTTYIIRSLMINPEFGSEKISVSLRGLPVAMNLSGGSNLTQLFPGTKIVLQPGQSLIIDGTESALIVHLDYEYETLFTHSEVTGLTIVKE